MIYKMIDKMIDKKFINYIVNHNQMIYKTKHDELLKSFQKLA